MSPAPSYPPLALRWGHGKNDDNLSGKALGRKGKKLTKTTNCLTLGYPHGPQPASWTVWRWDRSSSRAPPGRRGRPGPTTLAFIEGRTKQYLKGDHLRRISFDVTGMTRLTGAARATASFAVP